MSRSRRGKLLSIVETIWRLHGASAARLYVDRFAARGTGIRCPACAGKGSIPFTEEERLQRWSKTKRLDFGAHDCDLCSTYGALRPRGDLDRDRVDDRIKAFKYEWITDLNVPPSHVNARCKP